jgi:hypothetical protein
MKTTLITTQTGSHNENGMNLSLLIAAACFLFFGSAMLALAKPAGNNIDGVSRPYQIIKSPGEFERLNPAMFISVEGEIHENFFGNKFKLLGELKNIATAINYRDLVFEIVYYGIVGQEIARKTVVLHQELNANSSKIIEFKIRKPKGCKKIEFIALDATAY